MVVVKLSKRKILASKTIFFSQVEQWIQENGKFQQKKNKITFSLSSSLKK